MPHMRRITKTSIITALLVFSWISVKFSQNRVTPRSRRVIGGINVLATNHHPFIVSIESGNRQCAGTLISDKYVLTAAHCVFDKDVTDISVKLGSFELNSKQELLKLVDTKIVHPNYNEIDLDIEEFNISQIKVQFDVALLRLAESMDYFTSSIQPVKLVGEEFDFEIMNISNLECTILGWGQTIANVLDSSSPTLQKLEIEILKNCSVFGSDFYNSLSDSEFCAVSVTNSSSDACKGDSGGPLICGPKNGSTNLKNLAQIGIISWGVGCANNDLPGVYGKIEEFLPWIEEHVNLKVSSMLSNELVVDDICFTDADCDSLDYGFYRFISKIFQKQFAVCGRNHKNLLLECECHFTNGEYCEKVAVFYLVLVSVVLGFCSLVLLIWKVFMVKKCSKTMKSPEINEDAIKLKKFLDTLNRKKLRRNSRKVKPKTNAHKRSYSF